ncbi:Hypothetical predicted protein, partial [Pelobates cultripes]
DLTTKPFDTTGYCSYVNDFRKFYVGLRPPSRSPVHIKGIQRKCFHSREVTVCQHQHFPHGIVVFYSGRAFKPQILFFQPLI